MSGGRRALLLTLCVWLAGLALAGALHDLRGALDSGFGAGDDEAAHLVSGVMVHDYLLSPTPANPVDYAKGYYTHYPKVAIGQWPPVYHGLQALWTLVLGVSRTSIVLFGAAIAAGAAALVYAALARSRGALVACAGALLLLALPMTQHFSAMPGTEVLISLFALAAVMAFGRFLDVGGWRPALAFGAFATLAILTKGNALALALVPPISILFRRQWCALRSPALWVVALLVGLLAGPWTMWFLEVNQSTWGGGASANGSYSLRAAQFYVKSMVPLGGPIVLALAAWGAWTRLRSAESRGLWSAAFAWCVAVPLFHVVVPSSIEARHLILLLPCLCLFAADGAFELVGRLPGLPQRAHAPAAAVLLLGGFAILAWEFPHKHFSGYDEAVEFIREQSDLDQLSVLVESDSVGEGLAVTEFVLADERQDRHVLRATKFLSRSSWTGEDYHELYPDPEQLSQILLDAPVGLVLFDRSVSSTTRALPHRATLAGLIDGGGWQLLQSFDVVRAGRAFPAALELWRHLEVDGSLPLRLQFSDLVGREVPGVK